MNRFDTCPRPRAWGRMPWLLALLPLLAAWTGGTAAPAAGFHERSPQAPTDPHIDAVLAELEPAIRQAMVDGRIPGLSIALVAGEEIVWSGAYGEANRWARTPATPSTVYLIASTFKPMATFALLQQMEAGHFELDDPVRDHLGDLAIAGEDPEDPITFRQLLTHTSGLPTRFTPLPVWDDEAPPTPESYISGGLRVEGPPMERVRYSNPGFTLIAHLVERMSGREFRDYVRREVFRPLEMESTDFVPSAEMDERMAIPYAPSGSSGALAATDRVRFAEWPAGGVFGTVLDQARFLIVNLNGGSYGGRRLLSEETVDRMHTRQHDGFTGPMAGGWGGDGAGYGLAWWTSERRGERLFAHSGSVRGYTAFLHGNRDRRLGVAILTNGHRAHPHLVRISGLATRLMAEHLPEG